MRNVSEGVVEGKNRYLTRKDNSPFDNIKTFEL